MDGGGEGLALHGGGVVVVVVVVVVVAGGGQAGGWYPLAGPWPAPAGGRGATK